MNILKFSNTPGVRKELPQVMSERARTTRDTSTADLKAQLATPDTDVPKDHFENHRERHGHLTIGAGIATVALLAGGVAIAANKMGGEKSPTDTRNDVPATASPNPGDINKDYSNIDLSGIRGIPTQEQIKAAMERRITIADYSDPLKVIEEMGNLSNIFAKSGEVIVVDNNPDGIAISEESVIEGDTILNNIYGDHLSPEHYIGSHEFRLDWSNAVSRPMSATELYIYYVPRSESVQQISETEYKIQYEEYHEGLNNEQPNRELDFLQEAILIQENGVWHMDPSDQPPQELIE